MEMDEDLGCTQYISFFFHKYPDLCVYLQVKYLEMYMNLTYTDALSSLVNVKRLLGFFKLVFFSRTQQR